MSTEFYTDALHGFIAAHLFLCAAVAVFAYMLIKIFNLLRKYVLGLAPSIRKTSAGNQNYSYKCSKLSADNNKFLKKGQLTKPLLSV